MKKVLAAAFSVAAVALVIASVSTANHNYSGTANSVAIVAGNPGCPSGTIVGPKIDPGANYSDQYINVTGFDGTSFDWAFTALGNQTYDMAVIIVKGGPLGAAVYTYDYTSNPAFDDSDTNLATPTNPNNGKDSGISHIQICYDPKGGGDN
jgi:hypothetical protein